jgi:hypothetical protein
MACACKKANKISKLLTNQTNAESKGVAKVIRTILSPLLSLLQRLVVVALFIILIPIVLLFLAFHFMFKGHLNITLPKSVYNILKTAQT